MLLRIYTTIMKITRTSNISIAFWNIDNVHYSINRKKFCKLDDEDIKKALGQHDIICLLETHCSFSDTIELEGYSTVMNVRPKSPKATKHSGGIAILVKTNIKPGVTFLPLSNTEFMWIKLNKKFFNMQDDLFVAAVYKCPANSSYANKTEDIFELIENDVAMYS